MTDRGAEFIDLMVEAGVLTFGDFTTKSGRSTPYFINTGRYATASQMRRVGEHYAAAIVDAFGAHGFDVLFGPAYKGIPLATAVACALEANHGVDARFCFNRKEAKDHGEGGSLVGAQLRDGDRVLIVEDVTTAGTSIRETVPVLRAAAEVQTVGLVVSVDRMERGADPSRSALEEVGAEFGLRTVALVDLDAIVERLRPGGGAAASLTEDDLGRIESYRARWGVER